MLPFLKNQKDGAGMGEDEPIKRQSDEPEEYDTLSACAEDIMSALERKDVSALKEALKALVDHIQDQDEIQDEGEQS